MTFTEENNIMSYHKTTVFYELQINQLLEEYGEVMPPQVRERLQGMLQNPNSEAFGEWLSNNKAIK